MALLVLTFPSITVAAAATVPAPTPGKPVVLAHYYLWFDRTSWQRAKTDFPLVGRYSSDDPDVMREHIRLAKSAGINGFIVSWKSTRVLDERLRALVEMARREDFKLAITYQGLTFDRVNMPPARIASDLDGFAARYGDDPVFDIFGKPVVALTGTPGLTAEEVSAITDGRRKRLLILATDKDVDGYERLAEHVDGLLYYWSSVDPLKNHNFGSKLAAMSAAVRGHSGLWIAPVAPGFDARLVGGKSVVERRAGETLRQLWSAALASVPDAIGIISWNEFSENTAIEPSTQYGNTSLATVAALTHAANPSYVTVDSSDTAGTVNAWQPALVFGGSLSILAGIGVVAWRRRRLLPGGDGP